MDMVSQYGSMSHARERRHPKLLFVNSQYYPDEQGGAERNVRLTAEAFAARGCDVVVACLTRENSASEYVVGGVRVLRIPLANLYWPFSGDKRPAWQRAAWHAADTYNLTMGKRFDRILETERPDLVHFHNIAGFSAAIMAVARRRGIPALLTVHDYYFACPRTTMFRRGRNCDVPCVGCRLLTIPRRVISGHAEAICGVSVAMLDRLCRLGLFLKARHRDVIYNPVGPAPAVEPRPNRPRGGAIVFGYIGRLDPTKGIETLLSATRSLVGLPISVIIAGRGPRSYEAELAQLAEGLAVRFVGFQRPEDFFSKVDVLVVPSIWHEPFGRVVQEAFSFGVPVIGATSGGIPEAIGSEKTGFLFPPGDVGRLSEIMRHIVADGFPAAQYFATCRARSQEFDIDSILAKQISTFSKIAPAFARLMGA